MSAARKQGISVVKVAKVGGVAKVPAVRKVARLQTQMPGAPGQAQAPVNSLASEQLRNGDFTPLALVNLLFSVAGPMLDRLDLLSIVEGGADYVKQVNQRLGAGLGKAAARSSAGHCVVDELANLSHQLEAATAAASAVGWAASELAERGNP